MLLDPRLGTLGHGGIHIPLKFHKHGLRVSKAPAATLWRLIPVR